jgi:hypothetical protein
VEFGFNPSARAFWPWRRFGLPFPFSVNVHVTGLTILSRHFPPRVSYGTK